MISLLCGAAATAPPGRSPFGFASLWLYSPCSSGKAFSFSGLSGFRPIFLKLQAELGASTARLSLHSRIRAGALYILLRSRSRSTRTLAFGFAGFWLYSPCSSGKAFSFPGLSGFRPIFLKLKAELCASTARLSLHSRIRAGALRILLRRIFAR